MLHLLRGAGIRGASGMRALMELEVPWWQDERGGNPQAVRIWRPFLSEPAESVRNFAESLDLPIVEDESNADLGFRRNAIRHRALPVLEAISPGAVANLARFAELAGEDSDELERQATLMLHDTADPDLLPVEVLDALSLALRRRVLLHWCRHRAHGVEIGLNRIDEVLRVAGVKERERRVEIGSGWSVLVSRDGLRLLPPALS